jgi:hypothetical protein
MVQQLTTAAAETFPVPRPAVRLRATRPPENKKQPDGVQQVSLLFFFFSA